MKIILPIENQYFVDCAIPSFNSVYSVVCKICIHNQISEFQFIGEKFCQLALDFRKKFSSTPFILGGDIHSERAIQRIVFDPLQQVVLGRFAVQHYNVIQKMSHVYPFRLVISIDDNGGYIHNTTIKTVSYIEKISTLPVDIVYVDECERTKSRGINKIALSEIYEIPIFGRFIYSGGISSKQDLEYLKSLGIDYCIIGTMLYNKRSVEL